MGVIKGMTAAAVMVLSTWATRALAQSAPTPTIPIARETMIDVVTSLSYDSNVAGSDAQFAALRGLKLADEMFEPNADFVLARPLGGQIFFVQGSAGYIFHRVNTVLDRQNVDVTAGVNARFLRCQEVVTGGYASYQSDLNVTQAQVVRNTIDVGTVGGTVTCGRRTGLAPSLAVTGTWRTNSAGLLEQLNSNTVSVSPSLAYQRPTFGSLAVFGTYDNAEFSNQLPQVLEGLRLGGYDLYTGGFRYDRHLGGRIEGSVALSYTSLIQNTPGLPNFSGFTYVADGYYHLTNRLTAHVNATRATIPSEQLNINFAVEEQYEGDIKYALTSRLFFQISASTLTQDYQVSKLVSTFEFTHETIDSITASSTFQLNRRISLDLIVGDRHRNANVSGLSYSSTNVELQAKATF